MTDTHRDAAQIAADLDHLRSETAVSSVVPHTALHTLIDLVCELAHAGTAGAQAAQTAEQITAAAAAAVDPLRAELAQVQQLAQTARMELRDGDAILRTDLQGLAELVAGIAPGGPQNG